MPLTIAGKRAILRKLNQPGKAHAFPHDEHIIKTTRFFNGGVSSKPLVHVTCPSRMALLRAIKSMNMVAQFSISHVRSMDGEQLLVVTRRPKK